ncbi:MaoC family dehydratase [Rhodococcoides kyotonense]|uniref:Acyl dehydratase n=1 Tax=Rhodococcoides kyotonense TaxID=398843 RepID=A0A239N028_9NOCA|nr:MaoC/PaaZ C-terminal domain-containing protein [Rhodococcus kyotonensis]SNT47489.1 Acyl dehydratase [Rhodococcus kyotonensis]
MTSLELGTPIPEYRVVVRAEAMKPMALLLRDPNPIHWDTAALRALGLDERPINQGPLNVSYIWEAVTAWLGPQVSVRRVHVRFLSNALAGEHLVVGGEVIELDPDDGTVTCFIRIDHDNGQHVLTGNITIGLEDRL